MVLFVAAFAGFGCQSISSPSAPNVRPDGFSACSDYHRQCRDRCAPADVKEVACYADDMAGIVRVCECEGGTAYESTQPQPPPGDGNLDEKHEDAVE